MENLELYLTIAGIVVAIIVILWIILRRRKNVNVTGASIGPLNLEFSEKSVEDISILSSPLAACRNERLTPPLKVKLMDEEQHILKNRKVRLEIYGENGIVSARKISGALTRNSDNDGIAIFDDLALDATGTFKIFIICEKQQISTDDIDILPPGLPIDFWNYQVGSPEYEERFDRILRFKTNERGI
ncbi:hypothetical protein ABFO11_14255 [Anaerostipes caccae]|uniref:hypothetical protein n=1 Tax=Anaerostipes caccae TaxID=105841 RepID=UPI0032137A56